MYTFYDARNALAQNFDVANRYGSDLIDDVARWVVERGDWILNLPWGRPAETDRWLTANARKVVREYFDYVDLQNRW